MFLFPCSLAKPARSPSLLARQACPLAKLARQTGLRGRRVLTQYSSIPTFHYSLAQTGFFFQRHCPTSVAPGRANCERSELSSTVCERLKKLPLGHYLDLQTYKRNRSIIVAKINEEDLLVIENGYFKERFRIKPEKLKKSLKTLVGKEFPRSRKIRLYVMGKFVEGEALNTKRKIL